MGVGCLGRWVFGRWVFGRWVIQSHTTRRRGKMAERELYRYDCLVASYNIRTQSILLSRRFWVRALGDGRVAPRALGVGVGCGRWVWALGVWALGHFPTSSRRRRALSRRRARSRHAVAARYRTPPSSRPRTSSSPPPDHEAGAPAPTPQCNHRSAPRGEGREAAKKFFWALGVENRALGVWDRALGATTPIRATGVGGGVGVG